MSLTIGQQLKQARERKRLSLDRAAEGTHIRPHYLQALEADDYSVIPSAAQARGFLRNYSNFLGLDLDAIVAEIQRTRPVPSEEMTGPLPEVEFAPPPPEPMRQPPSSEPTPTAFESLVARIRKPKAAPDPALTLQSQERTESKEPEPNPLEKAGGPPKQNGWKDASAESRSPHENGGALPSMSPEEKATSPSGSDPGPTATDTGPAQSEMKAQDGLLRKLQSFITGRFVRRPEETINAAEPARKTNAETVPELLAPPEQPSSPATRPEAPTAEIIETAEKIFGEIGAQLRQRRELLSLTPEEVERHTHLRVPSIKALEAGDFNQLSSAVQTRGMLANYATFLDLDADALLLRYADALQASHRARHPYIPGKSREPLPVSPRLPPIRSFMAGDVIFGVSIVVMVVALVVWGLNRVFAEPAQPAALPTAPSISEVLAEVGVPTAIQEVTLIPILDTPGAPTEESTATPEASPEVQLVDPNVTVSLTVVAIERTFMRVEVDEKEVFNGRVVPGTAYSYQAITSVQILTGNGAALRVTYNGRDMGLLGTYGQVAAFVYTANGIATPLPAFTPTGTSTPLITPTPTTTPSPAPATRTPVKPSLTPAS